MNTVSIKSALLAGALAAVGLAGLALPSQAQASTYFSLQIGPRAPLVEVVPVARPGYVWAPGHYEWRRGRYDWVGGHWLRARPGYVYAPPVWVERGGRWHYRGPSWNARPVRAHGPRPWGDRDHDGVRNRWDRDRDGDGVPNRWERRDRDHDGVRNRRDHDRDGDGVRNRHDRRPNDRHRY